MVGHHFRKNVDFIADGQVGDDTHVTRLSKRWRESIIARPLARASLAGDFQEDRGDQAVIPIDLPPLRVCLGQSGWHPQDKCRKDNHPFDEVEQGAR